MRSFQGWKSPRNQSINVFSPRSNQQSTKNTHRTSSDGTTACRPGAWEEVGVGDDLGKGRHGEKESNDEREAKHWESDLQRLG